MRSALSKQRFEKSQDDDGSMESSCQAEVWTQSGVKAWCTKNQVFGAHEPSGFAVSDCLEYLGQRERERESAREMFFMDQPDPISPS